MFTVITMNSVLGRLLTSTSLSCASVILAYPMSGTYSSAVSFCHLTFYVCGLFPTVCRLVLPLASSCRNLPSVE